MLKDGKYIYCIIETEMDRYFGPTGVGDRHDEVMTIGFKDLSMVVSNHPLTKLVINRENMIAHERIIEIVMEEFKSVLPVRFGTIAASADEIRNLLDRRYREFKNCLKDMEHKIELGVKGIWKKMPDIYDEIIQTNDEIREAKLLIQKKNNSETIQGKIEIGKKVKEALNEKKKEETQVMVDFLRKSALDYKLNQTIGDEMVINAAFLVDQGREKEFDNLMDDLSETYKERVRFIYSGPLPVFNFADIVIYLKRRRS